MGRGPEAPEMRGGKCPACRTPLAAGNRPSWNSSAATAPGGRRRVRWESPAEERGHPLSGLRGWKLGSQAVWGPLGGTFLTGQQDKGTGQVQRLLCLPQNTFHPGRVCGGRAPSEGHSGLRACRGHSQTDRAFLQLHLAAGRRPSSPHSWDQDKGQPATAQPRSGASCTPGSRNSHFI